MLRHYLEQGYLLLKDRYRTPFAEVDLILRSPEGELVLVEVKSLSSFDFLRERISVKQKRRLERAFQYFSAYNEKLRLELAVVSQEGGLLIFNEVFG